MNGGQIKKIIGIGASILSMVSMPFPRIIAKKLNLPYEEYSDNGISNDAIFRFISQANLKHEDSLIIVLFTHLYRRELIDDNNNVFSTNMFEKNIHNKKTISEYYIKHIFNEQLTNVTFWNRLYDIKLSVGSGTNTLFCIWDELTNYDTNLMLKTIYDKNIFINGNDFKNIVLKDNCFTKVGFSRWTRLNDFGGSDGHGTLEGHEKFASIILEKINEIK